MNPSCASDVAMRKHNRLSLEEASELLVEVRRASQQGSQTEICDFACVLSQVVDFHVRNGTDLATDETSAGFIATSLDELRKVFGSGELPSERMKLLRAAAINKWGEKFAPLGEIDQQSESTDEDGLWDLSDDDEPVSEADVVAPSAEEVKSLMSRLGKPSNSPTQASNEPLVEHQPTRVPDNQRPELGHQALVSEHSALVSERNARITDYEEAVRDLRKSPSVSLDSLDPELREAFLDDATSCVASIEDALLRLESDPKHADALNQILRELHTLKGASGSVGLSEMASQLHGIEDSLRDDQDAGRSPEINSLLKSVDSIRAQIAGDEAEPEPDLAIPSETLAEPANAAPGPAATPRAAPQLPSFTDGPADDESVRVKSSQLNRLMDMLAELVMLRNRRETELSELHEVYHDLIGSVSKMRILSHEGNNRSNSSSSLQLSEVANDVLEVAQQVRDCARPVAEGNTAVSQFIRQFRQELVQLRRTPVSGLFRRLQRVVRDTAHAESKDVSLELIGEDAGIERSLQQRLYEPLLHIVRNSVCHGIESSEERARCGKSPVGTITLEAKSGPDLFLIEIRDDGGGLDYDAIQRRGVERGLLSATQAPSREELSQLIFQPGFSTRETTNQTAGRGVGMDVVASTLQRMRGWLDVKSEPQKGTRIRMTFPLPSVIQHVMVFRSGNQLFALPMQSVQSAAEVDENSVCLAFSDLTGDRQTGSMESCQRIVLAGAAPASQSSDGSSTNVTLLVDEIVGPEEVVVRPLPTLLKQHPYCSGATLSGMGQTVLFLDARRVVETQSHHLHRPNSPGGRQPNRKSPQSNESNNAPPSKPRVLVVDDSVSARKRVVRSLQRYPIDVVEASDGKQALEFLKTHQFAAVFSDMEMPHVSGMELLAEINSDHRADAPPVVIISSRCEDEFTTRASQLGANRYLPKPLADDALDGAIQGIESLRHLRANQSTTPQPSMEIQ